jgi:Tol biopolymer transport system component
MLAGPSLGQVTQRVSVSSTGHPGNDDSGQYEGPSFSADGRYLLFPSFASNLVPRDTNGMPDVFLRDRIAGTTERVNVGPGGVEANGWTWGAWISADGRFAAFGSSATNLVPGDVNGFGDVFVRDLRTGVNEIASVDSNGVQGNSFSGGGMLSADGRFVLFESDATNLVPNDQNDSFDVFVRDRLDGTTERVSVSSTGAEQLPLFSEDGACVMSADGRYVAFTTDAANLVPGDTNWQTDVFLRDRVAGTTIRVNVSSRGEQADAPKQDSFDCVISPDGRFVGFTSLAANLVPGDTNGRYDAFVHDCVTGITERVSVDANGGELAWGGSIGSISEGGRFVSFASYDSHVVPGDTNGQTDVFVLDRVLHTVERVSLGAGSVQGNAESDGAMLSPDGRYVAFASYATNLLSGGGSHLVRNAFLVDRRGAPAFAAVCQPGIGGLLACPCANPPAGGDRGCDNSARTGGAMLAAEGGTFLSSDSLVFTVRGVLPSALSLLLQGTAPISSGVVYGQGVRCVGGSIRRLYTMSAESSLAHVPDFAAGDAPISARSRAMGDVIRSGEQRWYQVVYRDPVVGGGCPPPRTVNATQRGIVTGAPERA